MFKKILVALENGEADRSLMRHVTELAGIHGAELLLVIGLPFDSVLAPSWQPLWPQVLGTTIAVSAWFGNGVENVVVLWQALHSAEMLGWPGGVGAESVPFATVPLWHAEQPE